MARWTPFPLIGGAYSDDTKPWSAQDCLNYIPVPAEREGTRSAGKLVGVPGMTTITASMQEAPVRGLHDVEGALLAVTGNKLYRIGNDGAATEIGVVPGVGMVSMAHNQVQYGHEVMIANGQSGYVYNTYTGEFGQVTDDGFPGFKVVDFIDGYIAGIEPQGRFWAHSNLRDAKDYNTLDRYDAESAPDKMVGLIVSHREVMILNQRSASFFRNMGAATGTFQNSSGTELEVGGASTFAVARLDNTVYWLGNDGIVYRLAGHSPQRVSTGPIEQAIARCDMSKAFAFTFEDRGHKVFYLTFPDGQTWGFDVWTSEWHRRASENLNRWRINALVKWRGKWIAGDFSNGRLYQLDWAVQHEAGGVLERRRTTAVLHDNQNRVTVNGVELVVDTGLASVPDPILAPLSIAGDLPDGFVGDSGTYQYTVSGGVLPYGDFTIASGSLPSGATMDASGLVTYKYDTAGSYSWAIGVTDSGGRAASVIDSAKVTQNAIYVATTNGAGKIFRSEKGTAWSISDFVTAPSFNGSYLTLGFWQFGGVLFLSGGLSSNYALLRSGDGGNSWTQAAGIPATQRILGMALVGSRIIAQKGDNSSVYVSDDAGLNWVARATASGGGSAYNIVEKSGTVQLSDSSGAVQVSADSGESWAKYAGYSGSSMIELTATPSTFVGASRISGELIRVSTDGTPGTMVAVDWPGRAVASVTAIWYDRSSDRVLGALNNGNSIYSKDRGHTWLVGGAIGGTPDNSTTCTGWADNGISFVLSSGSSGKIFISHDAGESWIEAFAPVGIDFAAIASEGA